ncbi:MAG: COX15/CtaA family protein [Alphaproteobacteria bacterium]|nr:COX15/CtaA family protein [Alphaproteobacteria bacterium]
MTPLAARHDRAIAFWLLGCGAMIFIMVVLGGITRLTQSGLSITEWQPLTGIVPPLSDAAWQIEFAKYRDIPQYKLLHSWMSLDDFKTIFFWEWLHRLWGRLIGIAFALPFLWFLWRGRLRPPLLPRLLGILVLGGAQGALGWFMVESGLADRVEVSQYRLVAHLALALLIYAAILRVALGLLWPAPMGSPGGGARRPHHAVTALTLLIFVTMLAGGFVAGLNAGLTYNTFPMMDGRFVPAGYAQLSPWWRNTFENVAAVQFDHRILAELTLAATLLLWLRRRFAAATGDGRRALDALLAAALLQIGLGVSTLLLAVPIGLGVAHQAGALLLFTAVLVAGHALKFEDAGAAGAAGQLDDKAAALL